MALTKEQVIADIENAILQVVGEEWADEMDLGPNTNLTTGIELDSIEISKVIEIIFGRYPDVRFEDWFSSMDIRQVMNVTLGDIADLILTENARGTLA